MSSSLASLRMGENDMAQLLPNELQKTLRPLLSTDVVGTAVNTQTQTVENN